MSTPSNNLNSSDTPLPPAGVATQAGDGVASSSPATAAIPSRNGVESPSRDDGEPNGGPNTSNGDTVATQPTAALLAEDHTSSVVFAGGSSYNNSTDVVKISSQNSATWYKKSCKDVIAPPALRTPAGGKGLLARKDIRVDLGPDKVPTVFASSDILWNGTPQVINYFFLDGNDLQHKKVNATIQEWTWYANVAFHEATSAQDSNVRIRFDPEDGSWSYVGRQCDYIAIEDATMNLAWVDRFSPLTTNEKAVILHEFGHTLGLLHEHQSPAHGGYAVKNIQAAIDLYSKTQGWSTQEIYDQVINVYKISDVSNFSQVDTTSIMHYPQPKELTGLAEDIPYNVKLSKFDKAYMMLQYPRQEIHPQAQQQGWSYSEALKVIGAPPDVTDEILKLLEKDRDGLTNEINPLNIREVIEKWCREAHKGPSEAPRSLTMSPAHAIATAKQLGQITAVVQDGQDLCSTDAASHSDGGGLKAPAHAVTDEDKLWVLPADGSASPLKISYILKAVNADANDAEVSVPGYQEGLVQTATAIWSAVADVKFIPATNGQPADLVIQFNNRGDVQPEGAKRSICSMPSGISKLARKGDAARKDWKTLMPDIEYNGIFADEAGASQYKSVRFESETGGLDGRTLNMRSVLHELGHWLGLRHEYCGLYGYWFHNGMGKPDDAKFRADIASKYFATRYDAGSIMDAIGMRLQDSAMEVLRFKGLEPASVMVLQDKTGQNLLNRVNLSVSLSAYDEANIALLYPGTTNLMDKAIDTFKLKTLQDDPSRSVLEKYLTDLKLFTPANLETLSTPLRAGQWQNARKAYLGIVADKQKQEAGTLAEYHKFLSDRFDVTASGIKGVFDVSLKGPAKGGIVAPVHDGSKPQHAIIDGQPARAASDGQKPPDEPFIKQLYDRLSTLFCPGGGQYFALQFPTRFLDKQSYAYKLDGYLSRFNKPVVVNEAEFALTDALYDVAPIVGGPNGQSLSRNYSKALNSLIPTVEDVEVRKQREMMRQWLLTDTQKGNAAYTVDTRLAIPGIDAQTAQQMSDYSGITIVPGPSASGALVDPETAKKMVQRALAGVQNAGQTNPRGMTRMEFSDSLMQAYLNDRTEWELRRDDMIKQATEQAATDPQAMEKVTKTLAHITAVEEAKLASKYADAVVRGYSHTVRGFTGHLDIKTIAESLQDAKDSLRESALSSLYTASSVYPVTMQPVDWFESLDTGFTREELSQDPDLIKAAVLAKAQLIDNLENQIANLRGFNKGDPAAAKRAMEDAATKRQNAMAALSQKYNASTVSAIKLALEIGVAATPVGGAFTAASTAAKSLQGPGGDEAKRKSVMDILGGDSSALPDIARMMDEVDQANAAVNSASRELTEHMSEYATAVAGDTQTMIEGIQRQLTAAKMDLADLQQSYTISQRAKKQQPGEPAAADSAGKLPAGNGGSRWSEVSIRSTVDDSYTKSDSSSSSSVSSFKVNFWLGSDSNNSSTSSGQNSTESGSSKLSVDVAMRVTYVTVDRSGWFDPSFFEMSKSFMRGSRGDSYTPWSTWKEGFKVDDSGAAFRDNSDVKPTGYLAAYPIGYILVKDCVIQVSSSSSSTVSSKSHFDQQAESSGGFLCFSRSSASRSSADSSASSTTAVQGGIVIRIPGPQILGYMMQLTAEDKTQAFDPTVAKDIFLEETDKPKSSSLPAPAPAHDVGPGAGPETPSRGIAAPAATVRKYNNNNNNDDDGDESTMKTSAGTKGSGGPAHGIPGPPVEPGSSHMVDALQTVLSDASVADWLRSQPEGTRDVLWKKLAEVFGPVKA